MAVKATNDFERELVQRFGGAAALEADEVRLPSGLALI